MSKQKDKGKRFEDIIADTIHKFLLEHCPPYQENLKINEDLRVKRNPTSGSTDKDDGDIDLGVAKKFFPYSIECKKWDNLGDLTIKQLMNPKMPLKKTYILQCVPQANFKNLLPLLVFAGNRTKTYCFFDKRIIKINNNNLSFYIILDDFQIVLFEEFLKEIKNGSKL